MGNQKVFVIKAESEDELEEKLDDLIQSDYEIQSTSYAVCRYEGEVVHSAIVVCRRDVPLL